MSPALLSTWGSVRVLEAERDHDSLVRRVLHGCDHVGVPVARRLARPALL